VRILDLHPQFRAADGHPTDDFAQAIAIQFDCPGCAGTKRSHPIWAPFQGRYNGPGPAWSASGSGYQDLTFSDSPQGTRSIRVLSGCRSHFNVTGGAIDFYGDSGHTNPRETPMTDETTAAAGETDAAEGETKPAQAETPVHEEAPLGFLRTTYLKFVNGVLHQEWHNPFTNDAPAKVLVPVAGTSSPPGLLSAIEEMIKGHVATLEARVVELEKQLAPKA
jgi:hypothetical protein